MIPTEIQFVIITFAINGIRGVTSVLSKEYLKGNTVGCKFQQNLVYFSLYTFTSLWTSIKVLKGSTKWCSSLWSNWCTPVWPYVHSQSPMSFKLALLKWKLSEYDRSKFRQHFQLLPSQTYVNIKNCCVFMEFVTFLINNILYSFRMYHRFSYCNKSLI